MIFTNARGFGKGFESEIDQCFKTANSVRIASGYASRDTVDNYRDDFQARRAIIYTLSFTTKFYLYGPVTSSSIIKTATVDQYTDMPDKAPKREQRYSVQVDPITADADDNFGFNETTSFFQDAQEMDPSTGTDK